MIPPHVQEFCDTNGYTEPQRVNGAWWAFPPNGRMPVPIRPVQDILPSSDTLEQFRLALDRLCLGQMKIEQETVTLPDGSVELSEAAIEYARLREFWNTTDAALNLRRFADDFVFLAEIKIEPGVLDSVNSVESGGQNQHPMAPDGRSVSGRINYFSFSSLLL